MSSAVSNKRSLTADSKHSCSVTEIKTLTQKKAEIEAEIRSLKKKYVEVEAKLPMMHILCNQIMAIGATIKGLAEKAKDLLRLDDMKEIEISGSAIALATIKLATESMSAKAAKINMVLSICTKAAYSFITHPNMIQFRILSGILLFSTVVFHEECQEAVDTEADAVSIVKELAHAERRLRQISRIENFIYVTGLDVEYDSSQRVEQTINVMDALINAKISKKSKAKTLVF